MLLIIRWSYQWLRLPLLIVQSSVLCCHQLPFWSEKFHHLLPLHLWSVECSFPSCPPDICNEGRCLLNHCRTQTGWIPDKPDTSDTSGLWRSLSELFFHPHRQTEMVWRCRGGWQSTLLQHKQEVDSSHSDPQHLEGHHTVTADKQ